MPARSRKVASAVGSEHELKHLQDECARLEVLNQRLSAYIRDKTNDLLTVVGTSPLPTEELVDTDLVEFDAIGIVTTSFRHVLENVRRMYADLQFAHQELQAVFDSVGAALLVLDPHRRIKALNQKARELLVSTSGEVLGRDCRDVVCQGRGVPNGCTCDTILAVRGVQHLDNWDLDGRCFSVIGQPLLDAEGQLSHVVLAYTDVTERRRAEQELKQAFAETRDAKEKIDGILRSVMDGLLVLDADGRVVLANRLAEKLLDLTLSTAPTRLDDLAQRSAELGEHLREVQRSGEDAATRDLEMTCPDGRACVFQARTSVMRGDSGSVRGTITFLHEVTREREVERLKSEFVTTAAHELRTPLASILGFSELLLMEQGLHEEQRRDALAIIHEKSERLAEIVNDLLDISRIESGEALAMSLQPVRLDALFDEVLINFRSSTSRHEFRLDLPEREVLLQIDRAAVTQALENLLSNAVKYSPRGGTIRIAARIDAQTCRISVADEGIGMTPEQQVRVFEKFYRADASNTAVPGTGLGMTIVKHVVEAHGGEIRLDSQVGRGTSVAFSLPLPASP